MLKVLFYYLHSVFKFPAAAKSHHTLHKLYISSHIMVNFLSLNSLPNKKQSMLQICYFIIFKISTSLLWIQIFKPIGFITLNLSDYV